MYLPGGGGGGGGGAELGGAGQGAHAHAEAGGGLVALQEGTLGKRLDVVGRGLAEAGVLPEAARVGDGGHGAHPGLHVRRRRHDLRRGHLLHLLQRLLTLRRVQVARGALAWHLQIFLNVTTIFVDIVSFFFSLV